MTGPIAVPRGRTLSADWCIVVRMHEDPAIETEAERLALEVVSAYMEAFNARDLAGTDAALHFPHVRLASGEVRVMERAGTLPPDFFERFAARSGWHHSQWDYRRVIQSSDDKVHVAVCFTRHRADGSVIGRYESIWIVTKKDGRWGIQARSSFAP